MDRSTLVGRGRLLAPRVCLLLSIALGAASPVIAGETVKYSYDAKGRLTNVVHSGTVNSGAATAYSYDAADNRTQQNVAGYSAAASVNPVPVVVIPLNGLQVIVIPPDI